MRTPGRDRELAAGFLIAERIVREPADLLELTAAPLRDGVPQHNVVDVRLSPAAAGRLDAARRLVTTTASCGLCGRQHIESLAADGLRVEPGAPVDGAMLLALPDVMRAAQDAFDATGGVHAAALVRRDGTLARAAEDVGRHNAVDKTIGGCWLAGEWPPRDVLLCVSGRASYEIVLKALVARIPIIVAVSAPSSLAIELADASGMTLAGFARDRRLNLYTHHERVRE
jgi:FdhD protein